MPWERRTRSLMAQGAAVLLLLTAGSGVSWLAGCGPTVGSEVEIRLGHPIYFSEKLFHGTAEIQKAKGQSTALLDGYGYSDWRLLYAGSRIRIINVDPDGYKVQIVKAAEAEAKGAPNQDFGLTDKVGWMTKDDIDEELR